MRQSTGTTAVLLAGLLFAAAPAVQFVSEASGPPPPGRSENAQAVEQRNRSAFALILGEFRTNLSDLIFIKTERYLDSGIAYAPHIDAAQLETSGDTGHEGHDHAGHDHGDHEGHDHGNEPAGSEHETTASLDKTVATAMMRETSAIKPGEAKIDDHDHGFVPTIIRTAGADFRGFIGHMEREVKPWRDPNMPHQHTAGTELLPWYRLGTYSDPHNVRMYVIGAWWLKTLKTEKQLHEALKFLGEGLKHNPGNFQILYMRGYILRELKRTEEAQVAFRTSATEGVKVRPANWDGKDGEVWNLHKQEQLESAMLMDVLFERDTRGTTAALELATGYTEKIPAPSAVHGIEDRLAEQVYGPLE